MKNTFLKIIQDSKGKIIFKKMKKPTQGMKVKDTGSNVHVRLINF